MPSPGNTVLGLLELDEGLSPDNPACVPREESLVTARLWPPVGDRHACL